MNNYVLPPIIRSDKDAPCYVANKLPSTGYLFFYNVETGEYLIKQNGGPYRAMDGNDEYNLRIWSINNGFTMSTVKLAITELADLNRISLVKDGLTSLTWDGVSRIDSVAKCFHVERGWPQDTANRWLKSWMLGAVGKVLGKEQNPVLVLEGKRETGKSYFAKWLGSAIESAFIAADIKPRSRTAAYNAQRYFVWEITNLDAIKNDAIYDFKTFITRESSISRAYRDPRKVNASFIATTNSQTHLCMTKEMGSRRFLILPLINIDWSYTEVSPQQLWAEAVARWRSGERGTLMDDDIKLRDALFLSRQP